MLILINTNIEDTSQDLIFAETFQFKMEAWEEMALVMEMI